MHPKDSVSHGLWKERWGGVPNFIKEHVYANFSKNLEPLSTCLVWKIARTPLPVTDKNNHLSKQFVSLFYKWKALAHVNACFPLRMAFLLLYVESSSSIFEHLLESIAIILSAMCLSQNMVNCGITLMLVSLIFLLIIFSWTSEVPWHLYFAPQIKASEIPLYHILLWAYNPVTSYISCSLLLVLVFLHGLHDYEVTLLAYFLLWIA
jgi:hypothetical protein